MSKEIGVRPSRPAGKVSCPICDGEVSYATTRQSCRYFQCSVCEFLFHRPELGRDPKAGFGTSYDEHYWEDERVEARRREREDCFLRALELVYLSSIKVENMLDFGCGLGLTVELLRTNLGINCVGIDPFGEFNETEHLRKLGIKEVESLYPPAYFDAIFAIEVFEHLEDPRSILHSLDRLLRPGGKLLINTSTQEFIKKYDPKSTYIDPLRRGHISIYSLKSLSALGARFGLTASFLGDRTYVAILEKSGAQPGSFPHDDNLRTLARLGDWFPMLFTEYMRLVFVEKELGVVGRLVAGLDRQLRSATQRRTSPASRWSNRLVRSLHRRLKRLLDRSRRP